MLKISAFAALAALFSSCHAPEIPKDTIALIVETMPKTLDPLFATDAVNQHIGSLTHAALVTIGRDLKPHPDLAESWQEKGHRSFTFRLRQNLKFQDGSLIQAEDVVRALKLYSDVSTGSPHVQSFEHMRNIRAENDRTVSFQTDVPQPFLIWDLVLAKVTSSAGSAAGPFKIVRADPQSLELERSAAYHETARPSSPRKIVIHAVREDVTRWQLLKRGDANAIFNGISLTTQIALHEHPPAALQVVVSPGINASYLALNFRNPKLADLRVRRAIAQAIDVDEILAHRLTGMCTRATGLLSALHADYEGDVHVWRRNLIEAEKLLDEAGFKRGADGIRFSLEFKSTGDKGALDLARIISEQLKDVGIRIRIRTVESATFFADIKQGNFDLFTSRWIGISNPSILYRVFHSSQIGHLNRGAYKNAELDPILERAMTEADDSKRHALFARAQEIVAEDLPYIFLWHWNNTFIGGHDMQNIEMYPNGSFLTLSTLTRQ